MKPIVAIVGRPNVGKSTLFNRITRTRGAIVDDQPGVTRDRLFADATWDDIAFTVVDTGGFSTDTEDPFTPRIRAQVLQAIEDADVVVWVLDGKGGILPYDTEMAAVLRGIPKPLVCVANKIDDMAQEDRVYDFYQLGIEHILPVSAEHKYGFNDFMDALVGAFPRTPDPAPRASDPIVSLAVVGRPNVGKSSLINRILGEERLLVSDVPGTTRDAVDTHFSHKDKCYRLIDTAGIRRKAKVDQKVEKFSIIKALKSLERCDVALIVMDAGEGITEQDITIAGYARERGCGAIFVMNKWDLVEKDPGVGRKFRQAIEESAKFMGYAPSVMVSARTGRHFSRIFPLVDEVYEQYCRRIGTGQVNRIIEEAVRKNEPPLQNGRRVKLYYGAQVSTRPPTFVIFTNRPEGIHFSYERYITNQIRRETGLEKAPVKLFFRQRTRRETFHRSEPKER